MIELHRTYRFCASHRLAREEWSDERNRETFGTASLPGGHGHNYRLTVVLAGEPDAETSRLMDLDRLDRMIEQRVVSVYDHRNMNRDIPTLADRIPTTEVVLQDIWERIDGGLPRGMLREVRLRQDEFLTGVYRGPGDAS